MENSLHFSVEILRLFRSPELTTNEQKFVCIFDKANRAANCGLPA